MDRRRRPFAALALGAVVLASVVAGCVGTGGSTIDGTATPDPSGSPIATPPSQPPTIIHPTGASDLVLRVETTGGFVAPTFRLTAYPTISIYGDGSVITQGAQIDIYPGPLMPNLLVRHISEAGIQQLLALAQQEGLLQRTGKYDAVGIADAGTTELTFVTDARRTMTAYALGEQSEDTGLDPSTAAVRTTMRRFIAHLSDLPATLGTAVLDAEQPYHATSIRLFVTPGAPVADQGLTQEPRAWPLATPLATFGDPFTGVAAASGRCGVVSGADLDAVLPGLMQANVLTPWLSDGKKFGLIAHPLLPGESGCPAAG